jgi:hypothetical protein
MEGAVQKSKVIQVRFPEEETKELPLPYVNAFFVQSGVDDFFVAIGFITPPEIKTEQDLERFSELTAKPLFRFATSRENIKRFIEALQQQYDNQVQVISDEE